MRWILLAFAIFLTALAAPMPSKGGCDTALPVGNIALDTECLKTVGLTRKQRAKLYFNRGFDYLEAHQPDKSLADYDSAIRLDPKVAQYYYERALALIALERFKPAVADLSKAISLAPAGKDVAASYFVRSEAYEGLKDHDRACTDYSKAVKLNVAVVEWLKTNQPIEAKPPKCG